MAHGLVNALNIYEVPLIVLGGTVAIKQKSKIVMLDSLVEKYFRGPKKVNIVLSSLGKEAGIAGALSLLI
jgi:predicted NBD/HSP70 family sugar kinase